MRIVMTGATGYIGSHVARKLVEQGYELYCIARPTSDINKLPEKSHSILIGELIQLYGALEKVKPDLLLHIAGMFLGEHNRDNIEQMSESNIVFPTILVDAACECGCKFFINTSSYWQCYGGEVYNPVNLYAATKQAFEDVLRYYTSAGKVTVVDLELFDVFGPDDSRKKVLNLVAKLQNGEELKMSPGKQKLYMCYIDDVVDAYLHTVSLIESYPAGNYVKWAVRGEKPFELRDIINKYLAISKKSVNLHWGNLDYRKREIMDPEGIGEILEGWRPKFSLEEGLIKYYEEDKKCQ